MIDDKLISLEKCSQIFLNTFFGSELPPTYNVNFFKFLENYYSSKLELLKLSEDVLLIYLIKKIKKKKFLITSGKFGNLGITLKKELSLIDIESLENKIKIFTKINKIDVFSISINPYSFRYAKKFDNRLFVNINHDYNICSLNEVFEKNKENTNIKLYSNYNLRKSLRDLRSYNYSYVIDKDPVNFERWYDNCYLKRMKEINGSPWNFNFFKKLLSNKNSQFMYVKSSNAISGGIFFLCNNYAAEIFSIASPKEFLKKGLNNFLVDSLYKFLKNKNINFVNWQRSSDENVRKFKIKWKAKTVSLKTLIFKKNELGKSEIVKKFTNLYVYPYEYL